MSFSEEDIPPIQRIILFDKALLANLDESSSLQELSQHILYYRDCNDTNKKCPPPSPDGYVDGYCYGYGWQPPQDGHGDDHGDDHGDGDGDGGEQSESCSYASETAIKFSSLCLTLMALPNELQCSTDRTETTDGKSTNPDCSGCVYLNTCTLAFIPLERSKTNGIVAIVQLSRQRGVADGEGSVRARLGTRRTVELVVQRIHALFELFCGGGIGYRLSALFNKNNTGTSSRAGCNPDISIPCNEEFVALKMDLRQHYNAFLQHCFVKGANDPHLAEQYKCNHLYPYPSLPSISLSLQSQTRTSIDELHATPLRIKHVPTKLQAFLFSDNDIDDQCHLRIVDSSSSTTTDANGGIHPTNEKHTLPKMCIGISSFYKGRHVHTKRLGTHPSDISTTCTPLLDTEQAVALYEYFTLCTHYYDDDIQNDNRRVADAGRNEYTTCSYFVSPPSKLLHPAISDAIKVWPCHKKYQWDGLVRSVYTPKIFLHSSSSCTGIQPLVMQSVYTAMFIRGDFCFIFYLQRPRIGDSDVLNSTSTIEQADVTLETNGENVLIIEQSFGECLTCLHEFMSTI